MPNAKLYPELIAVRIPVKLAEEIEDRLADDRFEESYGDGGLSRALRDAALRSIGRADLVVEDSPQTSHAGRQATRRSDAQYVVSPVKLTAGQKRAIGDAAKKRDQAASALMLNALCAEIGLPQREAASRRRGKTLRDAIRHAAKRIAPDLELPVDDGFTVPIETRRRIAEKVGTTAGEVARTLQADPTRVGWQIGRRRSSPPKKR